MAVGGCCFNFCALATSFNLEAGAEVFNSFSYAGNTNANCRRWRRVVQHSPGYSATFVTDHDDDSIEVLLNPYLSFAGSRMEVNVCETSLNDAEDRKFGFFR